MKAGQAFVIAVLLCGPAFAERGTQSSTATAQGTEPTIAGNGSTVPVEQSSSTTLQAPPLLRKARSAARYLPTSSDYESLPGRTPRYPSGNAAGVGRPLPGDKLHERERIPPQDTPYPWNRRPSADNVPFAGEGPLTPSWSLQEHPLYAEEDSSFPKGRPHRPGGPGPFYPGNRKPSVGGASFSGASRDPNAPNLRHPPYLGDTLSVFDDALPHPSDGSHALEWTLGDQLQGEKDSASPERPYRLGRPPLRRPLHPEDKTFDVEDVPFSGEPHSLDPPRLGHPPYLAESPSNVDVFARFPSGESDTPEWSIGDKLPSGQDFAFPERPHRPERPAQRKPSYPEDELYDVDGTPFPRGTLFSYNPGAPHLRHPPYLGDERPTSSNVDDVLRSPSLGSHTGEWIPGHKLITRPNLTFPERPHRPGRPPLLHPLRPGDKLTGFEDVSFPRGTPYRPDAPPLLEPPQTGLRPPSVDYIPGFPSGGSHTPEWTPGDKVPSGSSATFFERPHRPGRPPLRHPLRPGDNLSGFEDAFISRERPHGPETPRPQHASPLGDRPSSVNSIPRFPSGSHNPAWTLRDKLPSEQYLAVEDGRPHRPGRPPLQHPLHPGDKLHGVKSLPPARQRPRIPESSALTRAPGRKNKVSSTGHAPFQGVKSHGREKLPRRRDRRTTRAGNTSPVPTERSPTRAPPIKRVAALTGNYSLTPLASHFTGERPHAVEDPFVQHPSYLEDQLPHGEGTRFPGERPHGVEGPFLQHSSNPGDRFPLAKVAPGLDAPDEGDSTPIEVVSDCPPYMCPEHPTPPPGWPEGLDLPVQLPGEWLGGSETLPHADNGHDYSPFLSERHDSPEMTSPPYTPPYPEGNLHDGAISPLRPSPLDKRYPPSPEYVLPDRGYSSWPREIPYSSGGFPTSEEYPEVPVQVIRVPTGGSPYDSGVMLVVSSSTDGPQSNYALLIIPDESPAGPHQRIPTVVPPYSPVSYTQFAETGLRYPRGNPPQYFNFARASRRDHQHFLKKDREGLQMSA
ncbi:histone-lysine N-methyltransferase 2D-like isoform X3 [Ornithodoros turicata]|uniref:histone-lysine N-methyltransferase 2D-like isoform X3 n=1 Tax=Ornithodoros turicata TaxID=34597 RepID=UPI0031393F53